MKIEMNKEDLIGAASAAYKAFFNYADNQNGSRSNKLDALSLSEQEAWIAATFTVIHYLESYLYPAESCILTGQNRAINIFDEAIAEQTKKEIKKSNVFPVFKNIKPIKFDSKSKRYQ